MYRLAPVSDIFFQASSTGEPAGRLTTDTFAPTSERPSLIMPESRSTNGSSPGRAGARKASGIPQSSRKMPSNLGPLLPESTYGRASMTPTARFFSVPPDSLEINEDSGMREEQPLPRKNTKQGK